MYGAQTSFIIANTSHMFENDVEMYGAQTLDNYLFMYYKFENDVEMYGAQTVSFGRSCTS